MALLDVRGLPLSTGSDLAAELHREGVDLLLSSRPDAGDLLDGAIAADPDFALAHAARARLHTIRGESAQAQARIGGDGAQREVVADPLLLALMRDARWRGRLAALGA